MNNALTIYRDGPAELRATSRFAYMALKMLLGGVISEMRLDGDVAVALFETILRTWGAAVLRPYTV